MVDIRLGGVYTSNHYCGHPNHSYTETVVAQIGYVKIIGLVEEGTIEWNNGYRYYSTKGCCYKVDGSIVSRNNYPWNISRESTLEEKNKLCHEYFQVDTNTCKDNPNYVPVGSDKFIMKLGGIYITRMGFMICITRITRSEDESKDLFISMDDFSYYSNGIRNRLDVKSTLPSMTDIVYQKVSDL